MATTAAPRRVPVASASADAGRSRGRAAGRAGGWLTRGGERRAQEGGHSADLGGSQLLLHGCVLVRVAAKEGRGWGVRWGRGGGGEGPVVGLRMAQCAGQCKGWLHLAARPGASSPLARCSAAQLHRLSRIGHLRSPARTHAAHEAGLRLRIHLAPTHRIMSSMKPMALAAREPRGPAEMALTRTCRGWGGGVGSRGWEWRTPARAGPAHAGLPHQRSPQANSNCLQAPRARIRGHLRVCCSCAGGPLCIAHV